MKEIEFLFLALMCAVGSQDLVLSKLEGALGVTIGKSHLDNLQYTYAYALSYVSRKMLQCNYNEFRLFYDVIKRNKMMLLKGIK